MNESRSPESWSTFMHNEFAGVYVYIKASNLYTCRLFYGEKSWEVSFTEEDINSNGGVSCIPALAVERLHLYRETRGWNV